MSLDNLFIVPKTVQYGSHFVMSGVKKPTKTKYISIDTRFCKDLGNGGFEYVLPERICEVKSMTVTNIEVPVSWYNISVSLGNNTFRVSDITDLSNVVMNVIIIPDGHYTASGLSTTINGLLVSEGVGGLMYSINSNGQSVFKVVDGVSNYYIEFYTDATGADNINLLKFRLGWMLGYRDLAYPILATMTAGGGLVSEAPVILDEPRNVYLMIDEYQSGNQNSFVTVVGDSFLRKNIIARVATLYSQYPYGTVIPANLTNGLLTTDVRSWSGGKIELQRLCIQLVNENGGVMDLNGEGVSFCLQVVHEA